jgi:SAM-dependent methyltransferase
MADYEQFAPFYDYVTGNALPRISWVTKSIAHHMPEAASLLELGCGTGSVLAGLPESLTLTGLDRSPRMLEIARSRLPSTRLMEGDITSFELDDHFDVLICVFDTINHLPEFASWTALFDRAYRHLNPGGIFLFDLNTVGGLRDTSERPPLLHDFDGNTLIMNVSSSGDEDTWLWDIRVFERLTANNFVLHHEQIRELAVKLSDVLAALSPKFDLLESTGPADEEPTDESGRAYFAFRRRPSPASTDHAGA